MKTILLFFLVATLGPAYCQPLDALLLEAEQNSPKLKAMHYTYLSSMEKAEEVASLPNITFGVGYFIQEVETRVGPQRARFSAQQQIPWLGTQQARREGVEAMAQVDLELIELERLKLRLQVKQAYYDLYFLQDLIKQEYKNLEILKSLESLARSSLEVGKARLREILELQIVQNESENRIQKWQDQLATGKRTFNILLNRDPDTAIILIEMKRPIIQEPDREAYTATGHPSLLRWEARVQALEQLQTISQKEAAPTFGIGVDYAIVERRSDMDVPDNGKDVLMPMLSISIPLFSKKYDSQLKQLKLMQEEALSQRDWEANRLQTDWEAFHAKFRQAQYDLKTQELNMEQVEKAWELGLTELEADRISYNELLELQQMKLKIVSQWINTKNELWRQEANLEFIYGLDE